jgi:hypothetical protein
MDAGDERQSVFSFRRPVAASHFFLLITRHHQCAHPFLTCLADSFLTKVDHLFRGFRGDKARTG